jgi:hypothetical protein
MEAVTSGACDIGELAAIVTDLTIQPASQADARKRPSQADAQCHLVKNYIALR